MRWSRGIVEYKILNRGNCKMSRWVEVLAGSGYAQVYFLIFSIPPYLNNAYIRISIWGVMLGRWSRLYLTVNCVRIQNNCEYLYDCMLFFLIRCCIIIIYNNYKNSLL